MSSTSEKDFDAALDSIYAEVLEPAAHSFHAAGQEPFPAKPDRALRTYYVARAKRAMTREDFTSPCCSGLDDFEQRLAAHWRAAGRHGLADKAAFFGAAARAAYSPGEQDAEVSPLVYVMF